jgi:hypothetical protein
MSVAVGECVAVTPFCVMAAVMVMVEVPLGVPGTIRFELPPHAIGPPAKVSQMRSRLTTSRRLNSYHHLSNN